MRPGADGAAGLMDATSKAGGFAAGWAVTARDRSRKVLQAARLRVILCLSTSRFGWDDRSLAVAARYGGVGATVLPSRDRKGAVALLSLHSSRRADWFQNFAAGRLLHGHGHGRARLGPRRDHHRDRVARGDALRYRHPHHVHAAD